MSESIYGVKDGEHIPGAVLHRYLTDFAKKFGILERMRFNTKLETVEPSKASGWSLTVSENEKQKVIETRKLIIASGLTSTPNMPHYEGQKSFTAPIFHAKDFCVQSEVMDKAKEVVVIGGAKSAFDVAYAFATKGIQVDLVIRKSGQGPVWLLPPYVTPLKRKVEELLHTRFFSWFSPCPWGAEDGFPGVRNFLHGNAFGRWLVDKFWWVLTNDVITLNGYEKNPLVGQLKPWNSVRWSASGISINNYDTNFWDLVKKETIRIHTTDVSKLEGSTVFLENGEKLETDVVVCATGWRKEPSFKFRNLEEAGLGLPYKRDEQLKLNKQTDEEILSMFPSLNNQPVVKGLPPDTDPMRLYRFMVPPTMIAQRNLAFAGMVSTVSTSNTAAVQGLWITAYLDGNLDRLARSEQEITREVMLHTQWGKWRYPCGYGAKLPDLAFDAVIYIDLLLKDLGLRNLRKKGKVAEIFFPYKPTDYAGLLQEWEEGHEKVRSL